MIGLGIALILVIIADIILKSQSHTWIAMILGSLAAYPVRYAYKTLSFSEVAIYWASLVLIGSLIVAHFYYHEHLSVYKITGACLALGAIYLTGK